MHLRDPRRPCAAIASSILHDPMKLHFSETILDAVHGGEVPDRSALLIIHDTPLAEYRPYPSTPMNCYKLNFTFALPTKRMI